LYHVFAYDPDIAENMLQNYDVAVLFKVEVKGERPIAMATGQRVDLLALN